MDKDTAKDVERIAIIDPLCISQVGHNYPAASRYAEFFSRQGIESILIASRLAEDEIRKLTALNTEYCLSHYYGASLFEKAARGDKTSKYLIEEGRKGRDIAHKETALQELLYSLAKIGTDKNLALFYPSIDYYSLEALVTAMQLGLLKGIRRVYIRWIGVMENCCYAPAGQKRLGHLLEKLSEINTRSIFPSLVHSAESSIYASHLSNLLRVPITVTPTLEHSDPLPYHATDFAFCFPGSPRLDKGYDRIPDILAIIDSCYPEMKYTAYCQLPLNLGDPLIDATTRKLISNPSAALYPFSISQNTLLGYIQKSAIVVLPYSSEIYKSRSSAMLAEAVCYERQVVASSGCAFSAEIEQHGLGLCCNSNQQFAEAIYRYYTYTHTQRVAVAKSAREKFLDYSQKSYLSFFGFA